MNTFIWILENVSKSNKFYTKLNILSLIASTSLIKRFYPNIPRVFYCDEMTYDLYDKMGVLHIWDEIKTIPSSNGINIEIFWASSKLRVLSEVTTPVTQIDTDFFMFQNIEEHFNDSVIYSFEEKIDKFWYPPTNTRMIRDISFKVPRLTRSACNVSFLHLPNPKFTQEYAKKSLTMMREFTEMNFESLNGGYLVLSEQWLLKQLLVEQNIKHTSLISSKFDVDTQKYIDEKTESYIWDVIHFNKYFIHHGKQKQYLDNKKNPIYTDEINKLYRYITAGGMIDNEQLKKNMI